MITGPGFTVFKVYFNFLFTNGIIRHRKVVCNVCSCLRYLCKSLQFVKLDILIDFFNVFAMPLSLIHSKERIQELHYSHGWFLNLFKSNHFALYILKKFQSSENLQIIDFHLHRKCCWFKEPFNGNKESLACSSGLSKGTT